MKPEWESLLKRATTGYAIDMIGVPARDLREILEAIKAVEELAQSLRGGVFLAMPLSEADRKMVIGPMVNPYGWPVEPTTGAPPSEGGWKDVSGTPLSEGGYLDVST